MDNMWDIEKNKLDKYSREELIDMIMKLLAGSEDLFSKIRDATDLLNDCGYELIDGVWRDMEYYPYDME